MKQTLRILSVEDSEDDSELLRLTLQRGGYKVTCQVVDTPAAMRSALETQKWDVITSDHSMPIFSAPQALALAKEICPDVPFIILSGEMDLNLAVSLMKAGAKDYIQKRELVRLIPAIERELEEAELHRERLRVDQALIESDNRFREVLENSLDASYKRIIQTNVYQYLSPVFTQITGYTPEEMPTLPLETVINLIHPDDVAQLNHVMTEAISGNVAAAYQVEYRFKHKKGQYCWLQDKFSVIRDESGQPFALIGSVGDITKRKQAEEALQIREANLAEAQQIAHLGSWEWDMRLNTVHWSKEMFRVFDIDPAAYDGKPETLLSVIHPDDIEIVTHSMESNIADGRYPALEYRVIHKDGSIHTIFANGRFEFDESGKPIRSIGTVQDISERKRITEALRESEEKLKKAQHFARVGSWTWNIKTNQLDWSDEMFHIFGLERETFTGVLGDVIAKAIHPDDRDKVEQSNRSVSQDKQPIPLEYRVIWPDQSVHVIWAEAGELKLDEAGNPAILSGIAQDITLRIQAQEELHQSEERMRVIFETLAEGVALNEIVFNDAGEMIDYKILEVNAAFHEVADFRKDGLVIGNLASKLYEMDHETIHYFWKHHKNVTKTQYIEYVSPISKRIFGVSTSPFINNLFVTSFQDITERKQAEEQIHLLNAELEQRVADRTAQLTLANQELEAFSYSVSHDLRAPLRALDGFSAALISDNGEQLDAQGQHYLTRIRESSQRMGQLIEDLLNLSRVTRADFTRRPVDLSGLANSIAAELKAQSSSRKVEIEIPANMSVQGDENLLKIVLENLLNNAFKFTSGCERAYIQVGILQQDGNPVYFVRDNGVGFNMEYADRLFGAFQRLHSEKEFPGIGIGLAIVQRIIHRHGGRVWCEAEVDRGAAFYFTLG